MKAVGIVLIVAGAVLIRWTWDTVAANTNVSPRVTGPEGTDQSAGSGFA